jgi:RNA polymerase sigma factor (sigma-70 family)
MASQRSSPLLQFLRKIAAPPGAGDLTDGQLLQRFALERDEAAFLTLLRRHGAMVLGVCQSVLHDGHDAEDAFQATFLVLVSKARSIGKPGSVASWLHGVAHRLALKAKASLARQRALERRAAQMATTDPGSDLLWRDLRPVLHEEVNRLPEKYRAPFVLCYLEGKTNEEAAHLLRCPKGTVASNLSRARQHLRGRLTRRGLALSAGLLALALARNTASAGVPSALADVTVKAAVALATGKAALAGAISTNALTLARGGLQDMLLTKLKITAGLLLLLVSVAGIGRGVLTLTTLLPEQPGARLAEVAAAEQPDNRADVPSPGKAKAGADEDDRDKLSGTWKCIFARVDDEPLGQETRTQLRLVMTRDHYTTTRETTVLFDGAYRLDPEARPRTIDISAVEGPDKGKTALGIYAVEGDRFELCYTLGKERPGEFRSSRGSGVYLTTWERIKP